MSLSPPAAGRAPGPLPAWEAHAWACKAGVLPRHASCERSLSTGGGGWGGSGKLLPWLLGSIPLRGKAPLPRLPRWVGETPRYAGGNLFPRRGNLRKQAKPAKSTAKILTPPQRTHSCSSSCPGRGASRTGGFSGPLRRRCRAAPLARLSAREALPPRSSFPSFPSSWRTAEPSCPNPPTPPHGPPHHPPPVFFLCRAVPGREGQGGARYGVPGQGSRSRRARAGAAGPRRTPRPGGHTAPLRGCPAWGPGGKGSLEAWKPW